MPAIRGSDRTWLVALAASFWGLSSLWRGPLAADYPALAIVFWEHVVLTALTLPWLVPAVGRVMAASTRTKVSVLVIGAGSSALATTLFTAAFRLGDPITPQVLQKLQPLIALALAAVVLGERLRPSYAFFAVPALAGAWLLAFPEPLQVGVSSAQAALLALGAATLWAAGTVLGRAASAELRFSDLTALRFAIGLVTLAVLVGVTSTSVAVGTDAIRNILLLALSRACWPSSCTTGRSAAPRHPGRRWPSWPSPSRRHSWGSPSWALARAGPSGSVSSSSWPPWSASRCTNSAAPLRAWPCPTALRTPLPLPGADRSPSRRPHRGRGGAARVSVRQHLDCGSTPLRTRRARRARLERPRRARRVVGEADASRGLHRRCCRPGGSVARAVRSCRASGVRRG